MYIISSHDHSPYLELAITQLEENGIPREHIFAIPLDNPHVESKKLLDTIHHSNGISSVDAAMAWATGSTVIFSSYGFILKWGPIIWGLIGAAIGFLIGFILDYLVTSRKKNTAPKKSGNLTEVFLLVQCDVQQVYMVETILKQNMAFGLAKVDDQIHTSEYTNKPIPL